MYVKRLYNYWLSTNKDLTRRLVDVIGFIPSNIQLYNIAFSHKSSNGTNSLGVSNERLEYLGDSILSTVVAEYLFKKYPKENEGFLTQMRSKIVRRKTLNKIADQMGLDILLSEYTDSRVSHTMKGNALEALLGAIYLERGYPFTQKYIIKNILIKHIDIKELEQTEDNFKSRLLEHCQKSGKAVEYKLISRFKVDRRDKFKVAVHLDGKQVSVAEDFNKKSAEQKASSIAMKTILNS